MGYNLKLQRSARRASKSVVMGIFSLARSLSSGEGGAALSLAALFSSPRESRGRRNVRDMLSQDVDATLGGNSDANDGAAGEARWETNYPQDGCHSFLRATCSRMFP